MKVLKWEGEIPPFCKIENCKTRVGDMETSIKQAPCRLKLVEVNLVTAKLTIAHIKGHICYKSVVATIGLGSMWGPLSCVQFLQNSNIPMTVSHVSSETCTSVVPLSFNEIL